MEYFMEQFMSEREARTWLIQEAANDPGVMQLREEILDPVVKVLQDTKKAKQYIELGNEFIEANGDMLAKPYPTKRVVYPRKYVDKVLELFGFTVQSLKAIIRNLLRKYIKESEFFTIVSYPTNVIHVAALVFCDMITNDTHIKDDRNNLRDSARQQLGLTIYAAAFEYQFHAPHPLENIMAYTVEHLDRSWNLVRCENMINWIGDRVETGYAFFRSRMSLNLGPQQIADVLNRIRNSFRQDLRSLANRYFADMEAGNSKGDDVASEDEQYVDKHEFLRIRNNLIRRISGGDELYNKSNSRLYQGIANLKNVNPNQLYEFAMSVDKKDIATIIDTILYVFITKEGNTLEDIHSTKYIGRITKFPTAIDRAIAGKPVILPMSEKYEVDSTLVKAYICLVATYIVQRMNDVNQ